MQSDAFVWLIPLVQIAFSVFAYAASLFFIRLRVYELAKRSIVDNIREA